MIKKFRAWDFKINGWSNLDYYDFAEKSLNLNAMIRESDWFVIQQYTGLKDKSGKEIYEGDILLWTLTKNNETVQIDKGEVIFKNAAYLLDGSKYDKETNYLGDYLEADGTTNLEIVGNIFEK